MSSPQKKQLESMHDFLYEKIYNDMRKKYARKKLSSLNNESEKTGFKNYHNKLLDHIVEQQGMTRGKMTKPVDLNAHNSDESDEDTSSDLPLTYTLGFGSIHANKSNYKDLPDVKKEIHVFRRSFKYTEYKRLLKKGCLPASISPFKSAKLAYFDSLKSGAETNNW